MISKQWCETSFDPVIMNRRPINHTKYNKKMHDFNELVNFLEQSSIIPYTRLLYSDYMNVDYASLFRFGRRYSETLQHLELSLKVYSFDIITFLTNLTNLRTFKLLILCKGSNKKPFTYNTCECYNKFIAEFDVADIPQLTKLETFIYGSRFAHMDNIFLLMLTMMPSLVHIETTFANDVAFNPSYLNIFLNYLNAGKHRIKTLILTASTKGIINSILDLKGMNLTRLEIYLMVPYQHVLNDIGCKYTRKYLKGNYCSPEMKKNVPNTTFIKKISKFTDGKKLLHFKQRFDFLSFDMNFFTNEFPNLESLSLNSVSNMINRESLSKLTKLKVITQYFNQHTLITIFNSRSILVVRSGLLQKRSIQNILF